MKKLLIYIGLLHLSLAASAQYIPYSNQTFQYAASYNPAFSGIDPFTELKLGYRTQWTGFGSEGPKFANLVLNTRLKQPLNLTHNALRTSNPNALKAANLPRGKRIIHGFGANIFNEKIAVINRTGGVVNYSLHYPLSPKAHLATGLSAVVDNTSFRADQLYLGANPDPDSYYDNLVSSGVSQTSLNVRAGLLLYTPGFYLGVAYYDLVYSQLRGGETGFSEPHYRGSAQFGFSFPFSASIHVKPSVFALWQTDDKFVIDYNLKFYIEQKLWFGLTYRGTESLVTMAGFDFNRLLGVAYSYERSTSGLKQFSDGSHEIVLLLRLNNLRRLQSAVW